MNFKIKNYGVLLIVLSLLGIKTSLGQVQQITELKVGDKVPGSLAMGKMYDHKTGSLTNVTISDFKDRLIILDFWNTHCGPCIAALPKMDSLQAYFGDKIAIIPVAPEAKELIDEFHAKRKRNGHVPLSLPSLIRDTIMEKWFPPNTVPHEVWIDTDGTVCAITGSNVVTKKNIQSVLQKEPVQFPQKPNVTYKLSFTKPLLLFDNNGGKAERDILFQSMVTKVLGGGYTGMSGDRKFFNGGNSFSFIDANKDIPSLYLQAFGFRPNIQKYIVVYENIKDMTKYLFLGTGGSFKTQNKYTDFDEFKVAQRAWLDLNRYAYQVVLPVREEVKRMTLNNRYISMSQKAQKVMQMDLNRFFGELYGTYGKVEKRKTKCLVLIRTSLNDALLAQQSQYKQDSFMLKQRAIDALVEQLNLNLGYYSKKVVLDETKLGNKAVNLTIPTKSTGSLNLLRSALKPYGLDVIETEREIEVLVISEKPLSSQLK